MTPGARTVELGPHDDLFRSWCEVWSAGSLADRPDDPPRPVREHVELGRRLVAPGGSQAGTHHAVVVGSAVVGALRLILPLRDNARVAYVDLAVHPDHRRRGIGTALLAEATRRAVAGGRDRLIAEVDEPVPEAAGRAFAVRHGARCDLVETRRDLVLPPDERRLAAVEAQAARAGAGYELVTWRDSVPERLLADRATLERRMSTDAPHGDLPVEAERWDGARIREHEASNAARGRTVFSAGAVRHGRLVAFTDLHVPLAQPQRAHQGGTLVLAEHRGRRLGARVKVAVLRELMTAVPAVRRISTFNAETNAPMVAVNEALGFRPAGRLSAWSTEI